ncbi:hypothetical protein JTE90_020715 [Oedothorax gibbosus]|uniref:Neurotransmitter-gated ion-channel ligand-binding domain-containing protein n=1 Tax=Oedothorax gibbosus TaxID=931172 RepID=A0AAV6V594_9ARAC|nr:hypothetical protein JTE90_020715 [Oedothorax gibbosus]
MQYFIYLLTCLLVFVNVIVDPVSCDPDLMTKMRNVKEKIFKDYDKYLRPVNYTNTTYVDTAFIPRQIIEFDEERSLLSLDSFIWIHWFDPRLTWDRSEYDGELQIPSSMIWKPDLSVYNSHSAQVDPFHDIPLALDSSGLVSWFPPTYTQTTCSTVENGSLYPQDTVTCLVWLGSWSTQGWQVDFRHWEHMFLDDFDNVNPRWELDTKNSHTFRNEAYYGEYSEPYISIHVVLVLKRRPVPEIEATRAPCALVMCLALAIFWLPPDSSKKILLGGFLFVVLNLLLVYVGLATKAPLMVLKGVSFIQTTMYLVVITLLLQVFVVIKMASQTGPSRPPSAVTHVLTGPIGRYACLRTPVKEDTSLDRVQLKEDSSTVEAFTARDEWKLFAAAVDRALFVIMALTMIAVHHL